MKTKIEVGQKFILKDKDDFYHNDIFLLVQGGFDKLKGKELEDYLDERNREDEENIKNGQLDPEQRIIRTAENCESWGRIPWMQLIDISPGSSEFVNPPIKVKNTFNVSAKEWKIITRNRPDKFQPYNKRILV